MTVSIEVDEELLEKAIKLGAHETKLAAINEALESYVRYLEQVNATRLFGTIDFDDDFDNRDQRNRD